jgi:hypothetical protein
MIAFAFWGIPRGFEETHSSIVRFMNSFKKPYHVYFHTYQLNGLYSNPRNKEHNVKINSYVLMALNPKKYKIDDQDKISTMLNFKQYYTHGDPWKTGYNSVNNFILALYSKHLVTQIIESSNEKYEYIIYIRPDCKFNSFYYHNMLNDINDNTILIPHINLYGEYYFNDQFAITTNQSYKIYGNLFHDLYEYSKQKELHSETYNGEMLMKYGIKWKCVQLTYEIIRCNKKNEHKNFKLFFI